MSEKRMNDEWCEVKYSKVNVNLYSRVAVGEHQHHNHCTYARRGARLSYDMWV